MSGLAPRFSILADLSKETSSEGRREILRKVTETFDQTNATDDTLTSLDELLASVAADYSTQVRAELAQLVAANPHFGRTAETFVLDDIEVAGPVLIHSRIVSDATLLRVIAKNSQPHMMAVTQRQDVSATVSHALVQAGNDEVVVSLLSNTKAQIGYDTYEAVAERAKESNALQVPMVRRQDVPVELLNELYVKVEASLRQEIIRKLDAVSPDEIDKAFQRSRHRITKKASGLPDDFAEAQKRVAELAVRGSLSARSLATLLREGKGGRTTFILAFAQLAEVDFNLVQRTVASRDLDTVALLCRGAGFDRALYVTLSIALGNPDDRSGPAAEELGKLYETVPVQAAQRAIRFWKVRAAA